MRRTSSHRGRAGNRRGRNGRSRVVDHIEGEGRSDPGGAGKPDEPSGTETPDAHRHAERARTQALAPPLSRPWRTLGRRRMGETQP